MKLEKEVSDRIAMVRFIMITGVVFVHAAAQDRIGGMGDGLFDYLQGFFNYAAFRASVPLLALVSGYLLFAARADLSPARLWMKKARTLGLPFLVFNGGAIALFFLLQQCFPHASMRVDLVHASRYEWINAFFSIMDVPFNYPLYFVRDLLVLVILAPLFGWLLRNGPLVGLALVATIFYCNYDNYLIIRGTSAIMFYMGGLLAVKKADLLALDGHRLPLLVLFAGICLSIVLLRIDNINVAAMPGPFLVWPAFKYLSGTRIGQLASRYGKYSFFIFLAHAPLLQVALLLYTHYLSTVIPHGVFWLVAPTVIVAGLIVTYDRAMAAAPRVFAMLVGGRVAKPARVFIERRKTQRPPNAAVFSPEVRRALLGGQMEGQAAAYREAA